MSWYGSTPALQSTNHAMLLAGASTLTELSFGLTASYTYNTSGRATLLISVAPTESGNLTDFWFYVKSYTGTWASTDGNVDWEIREGLNGSRKPGATLIGSGSFSLDGTVGWKRVTGLSVALEAYKLYEIIMHDSDGNSTNYVTLAYQYGSASFYNFNVPAECGTTINGFTTTYSVTTGYPLCCVKVGTSYYCGTLFTNIDTLTDDGTERGTRFKLPENATFAGWALGGNDLGSLLSPLRNTWKLYEDSTPPLGTPLVSFTQPGLTVSSASSPSINGFLLPSSQWVDLQKDTWYRIILKPFSTLSIPRRLSITGSPDSDLVTAAMPLNGNFYRTYQSGGTGGTAWVDVTNQVALLGPILVPNADAIGGTGSSTHSFAFVG